MSANLFPHRLSKQTVALIGFLTVLTSVLGFHQPASTPALELSVNPSPTSGFNPNETPWLRRESLPVAAPSVHAPTLTELPNGNLAAAWFAGSREGAADVRIVFSERNEPHEADALGPWDHPKTIASSEQTERDTRRNVRKLGNPVLFSDGQSVHLFYVSAGMGGWAGSSVNHRRSHDGGENWGPAKKLITSPFMNVSTLVRNPPIRLADGSLGLPVYHELITKHGEWLRVSPNGDVISKVRMPHPRPTLQPSVIALDAQQAIAFLRDSGRGEGHVQVSQTMDAGQTWQAQGELPLTNPNASIAAIRLYDGRILLAANPGKGRHILELWLANADRKTWTYRALVDSPDFLTLPENQRGDKNNTVPPPSNISPIVQGSGPALTDESSYPALLQTRDGHIHLAYTWHRQRIRMMSFNLAWLNSENTVSDMLTPTQGRP